MKKRLVIIGVICFVTFVVFGIIWINKGDKMVQLTEDGKQVAFLQAHEEEMTKEAFEVDGIFWATDIKYDWDSVKVEYVGLVDSKAFGLNILVNYKVIKTGENSTDILSIKTDVKKLNSFEVIGFNN